VHAVGQSQEIMLAYPVGQGVRQLPQLNGIVAQFLAKVCLNGGHDFSLRPGGWTLGMMIGPADFKIFPARTHIRDGGEAF
jgi:hypothetical protein